MHYSNAVYWVYRTIIATEIRAEIVVPNKQGLFRYITLHPLPNFHQPLAHLDFLGIVCPTRYRSLHHSHHGLELADKSCYLLGQRVLRPVVFSGDDQELVHHCLGSDDVAGVRQEDG